MTAPIARFKDLCLDATDHQRLADWWCATIGYRRLSDIDPQEWGDRPAADPVPIADPSGAGPLIWIAAVPEAKVVKNRVHLDVWVGADNVDDKMHELTGRGARFLHRGQQGPHRWVTMADPEGNEFCIA